ncbi:hypothetical protein [uncultured Dysosmobacter sp.]|uniref:hypothetical protein n=1 Tax=uncultured Dysosmobacter sp. TaxID=2591384 RepID=UPI0026249278|nr:hypothetical protein [uncultured Dysosmobacter sp.]
MKSRKIALCGMLSALAVVVLLLGGAIGIGTFAAPVLAMAVLLPVLEEYGARAAATAFCTVSLLALLLVPDRELALVYIGFGWYPLLRPHVARMPSRLLRLAVRLAVCNGVIAALYGLLLRLLGLTADLMEASRLMNAALLVMGNLVFLLLDLVLARLTNLWRRKLRRRFFS